jgi:hypothetical protein
MSEFESYSSLTVNGFIVDFDTQKRRKYFEVEENRILELKRWGLTIRNIASTMGIPFGSIHYILRKHGKVNHEEPKTDIAYLDRKQWEYIYDITSSQYDYAVKKYPELTWRTGNRVYLHYSYFQDYILDKKGYKDSEERKRNKFKKKDNCAK